ncbi:aromatic amino acid ammonia-lyase [Polaromonas sp.]|uniref:HAL/PAL/TAL family ammonia-lyase n=1 Tax=Polaromonas sp. TaxID=1869339 RepID=UPI0017C15AF1|nr:aromatic amino acid ammonia-lyase [Polaromonas sp.]NMM06534.1 aromatic amino acid lyase [Polaromonas sp.]
MTIEVGTAWVGIDELVRVARVGESVVLAHSARAQVCAARQVVMRLASSGQPIYGLNSALGANTGALLPDSDLQDYQRRAVRARAVAVGPAYDQASVRAMQFARIAGLARGRSGVSPQVLDACIALLNHRVHPVVPRFGSIGVADLPQLSHLALPLFGEGEAEFGGEVLSGCAALERAGLKPVTLGVKDGLALISSNAATTARAALVLHDANAALDAWLAAIALGYEGFRANLSPIHPAAVAARPATGQVEVAQRLRALLQGSALFLPGAARRVQDPVSMRVVAQVHGAAEGMISAARAQVELELNSAADSPLVLAHEGKGQADEDGGVMLSNGNFHVPALALALDACAIALAQASSLSVARCQRFMSPDLTGLPLQLTRHGPTHSGFATVQKTLTALWAEIRLRANPGSLDYLPVSEGLEDHACMALGVAEKLGEQVERIRYLIAIELLVSAQAVDLRELDEAGMGEGARLAYRQLRQIVPVLDEDRPLGPDIDRVERAVAAGLFGLQAA